MDKKQQTDDLNWVADALKQNNLPASKKTKQKNNQYKV